MEWPTTAAISRALNPRSTKDGKPIALRRATPTANRRTIRTPRCPTGTTRTGSIDADCAGHEVNGFVVWCGCPGCGSPDVWHPASVAMPDLLAA